VKYTIISRLLKFNVVFLLLSICTPLCAQYSIIDSYLSKLNTQVTNATKEDQRTELLNKISQSTRSILFLIKQYHKNKSLFHVIMQILTCVRLLTTLLNQQQT
jgi:hypothetical protein